MCFFKPLWIQLVLVVSICMYVFGKLMKTTKFRINLWYRGNAAFPLIIQAWRKWPPIQNIITMSLCYATHQCWFNVKSNFRTRKINGMFRKSHILLELKTETSVCFLIDACLSIRYKCPYFYSSNLSRQAGTLIAFCYSTYAIIHVCSWVWGLKWVIPVHQDLYL